jgi:Asp-tRNA(Asn)/Glu-tRNA(Gln) amidotransferase A subunit family amidase
MNVMISASHMPIPMATMRWRGVRALERHDPDRTRQRPRRIAAQPGQCLRYRLYPPFLRPYSNLMVERDGIARAWSTFMAERPLVLSPTWTQLPFEHGFDSATPQGTAATMELMRPVVPANLMGLPSACVPAGRDEATGLPIGVLVTGQRFREDLCLEAAEAIEARLGLTTPIDPVR